MKVTACCILVATLATVAHGNGWCNQPAFQKYSLNSPLLFSCDDSELKTEISALGDKIQQLRQEIQDLRDEILTTQPPPMPIGSFSNPASNCSEIFYEGITTTGTYWLNTGSEIVDVICDFDVQLPLSGGWQEVADINMTDPTDACPSPWREVTSPSRRCERTTDDGGCESVFFPTNGVPFSKLCGRAVGYAIDTPDGLSNTDGSIEGPYVDGISITYTTNDMRQHIWSLAASHGHGGPESSLCRCGGAIAVPIFVEENYYCERDELNVVSPLWDGIGCDHEAAALDGLCCENPNLPWFCREFDQPIVTENIEARLCTDSDRTDEDVEFDLLKLYIQ